MQHVIKLSPVEKVTLEEAYQHHPIFRYRRRAHTILLSHQGYTFAQLIYFQSGEKP